MAEKKYSLVIDTKQSTVMLIEAVILLVVGILLCCSVSVNSIVNYVVGVALLVGGLINIILCFMEHKSVIRAEGVFSSALIAFGIICFLDSAIPFTSFISMFIIVIGAVMLLDGLLGLLPQVNRKKNATIIEAIVGAGLLVLGLCLRFIDGFQRFASLVLGIAFIVLAVLMLVSVFIIKSGKRVK